MTELEQVIPRETLLALAQDDDDKFVEWAAGMDAEELTDVGYALSHMSRTSAVRAGWTAYQIRLMTPDGEWGRKVWELAEQWEVSERTIHRWMSAAQSHYGLELTAAQKNSAASPLPTPRPEGGLAEGGGDDGDAWEDDPFAGLDVDEDLDPELAAIDNAGRLHDLVGEPWAERDSVTPSTEYENEPRAAEGAPSGRPLALPPDRTWVDFTAAQIQLEHPEMPDSSASRSAAARWARKIEEEPLDLLEELEMIYEASGESLPDETVEVLYAAEENKVLKPEVVEDGGKKRRSAPKTVDALAEKLLMSARDLHQRVHAGLKDGSVQDREAAAMSTHLAGLTYAVDGLRKMSKEAKSRADSGETVADRIAATLEAEAAEF